MKSFAAAGLIGVASAISQTNFDYLQYMAKFNKEVKTIEELAMRVKNFVRTHEFIENHNASGANWTAAHNQFSDMAHVEYKQMLGRVADPAMERREPTVFEPTNELTVDWVSAGAVTDVKDQGQCGSCWAFSTTGSLEGAHFIATGELLSFSEQQLVSCAGLNYGNYGCYGGLQEQAYNYYEAGYKAELETVYPYASGAGQMYACEYDSASTTAVTVSKYLAVTPDNVEQMKAALNQQPLAVSIEADTSVFQTYSSGVLDSTKCGTSLDHAVLAVGYGNDATTGLDYWLVKNSWNTTWGDQGYIKLAIVDGAGICGVQMEPLAPTTN